MVSAETHNRDGDGIMQEIDPAKVFFVIARSREFDAKIEEDEHEAGSSIADDDNLSLLENYGDDATYDDATYDEASEFINSLNVDEQVQLVPLA
jgi:hypothetical protein